jgi:[ribosomal protein S5]-alanine N-acetyltransferase
VTAIRYFQTRDHWCLRRADLNDVDGYHALATNPLVYQYLFDGVAPDKEYITRLLKQSIANAGETGLGMWFLESVSVPYAGSVDLRPYPSLRSAELSYLLDPSHWGQGLALRLAWTAITHAFMLPQIDFVIAGADLPNTRSIAVMRRLGMRFHKNVQGPLGAGVEYVLYRDDVGPLQKPLLLSLG